MPAMTPAERQRKSRENRIESGCALIQFSATPKARAAIDAECEKHGIGITEALNRMLERKRVVRA